MSEKKRENTSVISFSIDLGTLIWLDDYGKEKGGLNRSQVIRYLIRMGKTYLVMLEEQFKQQNARIADSSKKEVTDIA